MVPCVIACFRCRRACRAPCLPLLILWLPNLVFADEPAAIVNGHAISRRLVDRELAQLLKQRDVDEVSRQAWRREVLQQLIQRQLVLQYLQSQDLRATEQEVEVEMKVLQETLSKQQRTFADYLDKAQMSDAELRDTLRWRIAWQRYLERYLTEKNLEKYFADHRRDFDGTKLRVAQILLNLDSDTESVGERAGRLRARIVGGELSFAAAAGDFSAAPSRTKGGDIGDIERHQPMPEAFSRAAFELEPGEISPPVVTTFGVHLIQCIEVKPGQKQWQDVRPQLEAAVQRFLFQWLAERQEKIAEIEIVSK